MTDLDANNDDFNKDHTYGDKKDDDGGNTIWPNQWWWCWKGGGGMDRDKKLNVMIVQNNFQPVKLLH